MPLSLLARVCGVGGRGGEGEVLARGAVGMGEDPGYVVREVAQVGGGEVAFGG